MASQSIVRAFAEEVSKAFREWGNSHGWPPESYRLYLRFNEEWFTAHLIVVSRNVDEKTSRDLWKEIMGFLKQRLHDNLKHINMFNFTLLSEDQVSEGGIYAFGSDFVALEDVLGLRPVT
jgi:hypothetical protein